MAPDNLRREPLMIPLDQARTVRSGEDLDAEKVAAHLKDNLPGLDGPVTIKQFHSGFSNLTYLVTIGRTDLVLRRPPFGHKAKTAHDMSREFRILTALKPVFPYVPRPLLYCDDPTVMDEPFYVMERLQGVILRKDLPEGLVLDVNGAGKFCENWINLLGQLHTLDYGKCGLGDLGNPQGYVSRQVHGWSKRYRNARTDDAPDFETVMAWLSDGMPPDHSRPSLIHNDYKFDNVVLDPADPTRIIGVLDWEMATVGDPLMDLGASLGYWVQASDSEELKAIRSIPTLVPGMLTRRRVVEAYAKTTGTPIVNFAWYYCFGLFRLAVIAQQIYYRFYHGQTKDERFGALAFVVAILEKAALRVMETGEY